MYVAIRKYAEWMNAHDERILELLNDGKPDDMLKAAEIADSGYVHAKRSYISQRLQLLKHAGLVYERKKSIYMITDGGREYLDGRMDMRGVEKPE